MKTFTVFGLLCLSFGLLNASTLDGYLDGSGDYEDEEGSGDSFDDDEEEEMKLLLDDDFIEEEDEPYFEDDLYYDDDNDYTKDEYYDEYDYTEDEDDSVLKIQHGIPDTPALPDVEIKPRPESDEEVLMIETSQILIMVGSALVSFGVVILVFFTCRRSMQQRARKALEVQKIRQGPIVKSYHRVPGSTLQYLESSHIDMYRGDQGKQGRPLIE